MIWVSDSRFLATATSGSAPLIRQNKYIKFFALRGAAIRGASFVGGGRTAAFRLRSFGCMSGDGGVSVEIVRLAALRLRNSGLRCISQTRVRDIPIISISLRQRVPSSLRNKKIIPISQTNGCSYEGSSTYLSENI